jgi:hypothetical protein
MTYRASGRLSFVSGALVIVCVLGLGMFTTFLGNLWLLSTGEGYRIPVESSIFTFDATVMNNGSGDWWLYGEDSKNFYRYTGEPERPYVVYSRARAASCKGFDLHDGATWCP